MIKKIILVLSFWGVLLRVSGQDIITRSDGVTIRAQVLGISPNQINFRLYQHPDSLMYQISVQDVRMITRADGTTQNFNPESNLAGEKEKEFNYETQSGRNLLLFYPLDLTNTNFTAAYERIFSAGKIGIRLPVILGLSKKANNDFSNFRNNTRWGLELDLNFYPYGQGRLQYYLGPSIQYRSYHLYYYDYNTNPNPPPTPQPPDLRRVKASLYGLAFKNGVYFQLTQLWMVSIDVGLGYRKFQKSDRPDNFYADNRNTVFLPGNFHLGLRF